MRVSPVTLRGEVVTLEPLDERHAGALAAAVDERTFDHFPPPYRPGSIDEKTIASYITARRSDGSTLAFAVVHNATGRVIGSTCYLDIRPAHRGLEIGATFYHREFRGTLVNPECKLVLLAHAFDTLGAVRVQLKADARNTQSLRAIAKLGAVREGVLRKHVVMADGFIRDTVMYSIIAAEWPSVRAALMVRLGRR